MPFDATILLTTLIVTMGMFSLVWALHVRLKDAGIIDFYWGTGFAVIAVLCFALSGERSPYQIILLITTIAWALRLTAHIALRHKKSSAEDRRYARMRKNTGPSFWWISLFKIFLLQAIIMWLIATPQHFGLISAALPLSMTTKIIFFAGLSLFIIGFMIESIADWQLSQFKTIKKNHNKTCSQGLWSYSRHPNYFGEATLWWGFGLMGLALSGSVIALAGPALLNFLIIKVSGVVMLENHLAPEKAGYKEYISKTSRFFPRRPK